MKAKTKKTLIWLAVGIIAILVISLIVKIDLVARWRAEASNENFTVNISGTTELIGESGEPIKLMLIAKMAVLPLSFFVSENEVTAMRVTVSWSASGKDVDWSTLKITITATGTGGYQNSYTTSLKSGSISFTLPITVEQLGRTPTSGETVTWEMTINVEGEVTDLVGRRLTASLPQPIVSQVETVWYEPNFTITASQSTTTDSGTSGGGCGAPGHHVIWVYGVADIIGIEKVLPAIMQCALLALTIAIVYQIKKRRRMNTHES